MNSYYFHQLAVDDLPEVPTTVSEDIDEKLDLPDVPTKAPVATEAKEPIKRKGIFSSLWTCRPSLCQRKQKKYSKYLLTDMADVATVMEEPLAAWRTLRRKHVNCFANQSVESGLLVCLHHCQLSCFLQLLEFWMVLVFAMTFNLYRCAYMILFPSLFDKACSQKSKKQSKTKGVKYFYWAVFGVLFTIINI